MESLTPPEQPRSVSRRRVLVGVAERVEQISSSASSSLSSSTSSTDLYDARIMHRAVPAHLERLTVRMNASPSDLASAFGVPLAYVSAHWLHTDTPLPDTSDINDNSTGTVRPRRPVPLSSSTRREYAELAAELAQRLSTLTAPEPAVQKISYYGTEHIQHQKRTVQCGFGPVPPGVRSESSRTGQALIRGKGGLYRGARAQAGVTCGESSYTEVYVGYSGGAGGVCVGVMPSEKDRVVQEVMKLPGADGKSVAFHSSAKSVTTGDTWEDYGMPYGTGDTVGVKVNVTQDGKVFVEMFVNGTSCGKLENGVETLQEAVREGKSLHVAVALYRPGSRAEIRCCPQCWMYGPDGEIASCQLAGTKVGSRVSAEKDVSTVSADKEFPSSLAKEEAKRRLRSLGKNAVATQIEGKVREATCTSVLTP